MITIYCEEITARASYTFEFVFTTVLGTDYTLTSDLESFFNTSGAKFAYGNKGIEGVLQFHAAGLLAEAEVRQQTPDVGECRGYPALFKVEGESALEYDLFSAIFFMVTRYEEYLPHETDKHGRYLAAQSIASKHGFLERPIVDLWAQLIGEVLTEEFPDIKFTEKKFRYINTIDIDNAYAYTGKGGIRTAGAMAKSALRMDKDDLTKRVDVLSGKSKDPFDTYTYMKEQAEKNSTEVKSFVLLGDYGPYDKNLPHSSEDQVHAVMQMAEFAEMGMHPSYASAGSVEQVQEEMGRLAEIIGQPVKISRQHYLKLKVPNTYRILINCGIDEDHSMGYSEEVGFRAGTCTPFKFFDLELNTATDLVIFPFAVMDRTLNSYLNLNPEEAIQRIDALTREVQAIGGTLISVWHNESLSDAMEWEGWLPVYEYLQAQVAD